MLLIIRTSVLIILLGLSGGSVLWSQMECGQILLEEGQKCYENGRFEELVSLIGPCLEGGFSREELVQAYRLLALSHMANDDIDGAREMIEKILALDPLYTPNLLFDPTRYVQIVESMRRPVTSLVTASRQLETVKESPVPVTVITEQMIVSSGARNLKELLALFVPGMTVVEDHNELNIAMRGIYGSSQQKILVMLDGHRLNSRAYSEANPDFSISLEKIKQIEVLRGPASSLYGNVALTSVINIITKRGQDVSGCSLVAGLGNYGQVKASLLYGKQFDRQNDLVIWGNYYRSEGEEVFIPAEEDHSPHPVDGTAHVSAFKDKPAYDAGFSFHSNYLSLLGNVRYAKLVEPFSGGGPTGETYDYDEYRTLNGAGPGLGSGSAHSEVRYDRSLKGGWEIMGNVNFDLNNISVVIVSDPSLGRAGRVSWNEYSYGGTLQVRKDYAVKSVGKGNILAGFQLDGMDLYDSNYLIGDDGEVDTVVDSNADPVLERGAETIYSGFIQVKQWLGKRFILNMGGRYDYKQRHKGREVTNFSPRLSVIYLPAETFALKASFAQSFVDAPYWYRYNSLPSYKGSENLLPEHLTSLQLTADVSAMESRLEFGLNYFYNYLKDFIYRDPEATGEEPRYRNAGRLESLGLEGTLMYSLDPVRINANVTWQYALDAEDYGVTGSRIQNVPGWQGNLLFDFNPVYKHFKNLWFNITLRYIGSQFSPVMNTYLNGQPFSDPGFGVDQVFLVNAGIRIEKLWGFSLDARVYNLFGTSYTQGGSTVFPYPQEGRWWKVEVGYRF
ncbi:MAG: TonB-dependent receptor [Bacteroidales bacterium]|nr:TonB-dependent receptor [Lentimicrobiaceae bacterium]MDD5693840.1 TonB-dependent receptor [Bacteroidales bacterium]